MNNCDAKFLHYNQCGGNICEEMKRKYGRTSCILKYFQSVNKLIIDIDGNSGAENFPEALSTGSAIIKISAFL